MQPLSHMRCGREREKKNAPVLYRFFSHTLLLILLSKFVYLRGNRHRVERNRRMSVLTKLIVTGSPYSVLYSIMSSTTASKWEEKAMSHT